MTIKENLDAIITELRDNVPDITGVMVASNEGLAITNDFPEEEAARVAAVSAAAASLGGRICQNASLGDSEETMVKGADGLLLIYMAGESGVLAIRAPARGNLGLIRLEAVNAVKKVKAILN